MEKVVYFVPESSEKETKHTKSTERRKPERTGEEARQFYENLIAESVNSNETGPGKLTKFQILRVM